jgi:hypothetical protein
VLTSKEEISLDQLNSNERNVTKLSDSDDESENEEMSDGDDESENEEAPDGEREEEEGEGNGTIESSQEKEQGEESNKTGYTNWEEDINYDIVTKEEEEGLTENGKEEEEAPPILPEEEQPIEDDNTEEGEECEEGEEGEEGEGLHSEKDEINEGDESMDDFIENDEEDGTSLPLEILMKKTSYTIIEGTKEEQEMEYKKAEFLEDEEEYGEISVEDDIQDKIQDDIEDENVSAFKRIKKIRDNELYSYSDDSGDDTNNKRKKQEEKTYLKIDEEVARIREERKKKEEQRARETENKIKEGREKDLVSRGAVKVVDSENPELEKMIINVNIFRYYIANEKGILEAHIIEDRPKRKKITVYSNSSSVYGSNQAADDDNEETGDWETEHTAEELLGDNDCNKPTKRANNKPLTPPKLIRLEGRAIPFITSPLNIYTLFVKHLEDNRYEVLEVTGIKMKTTRNRTELTYKKMIDEIVNSGYYTNFSGNSRRSCIGNEFNCLKKQAFPKPKPKLKSKASTDARTKEIQKELNEMDKIEQNTNKAIYPEEMCGDKTIITKAAVNYCRGKFSEFSFIIRYAFIPCDLLEKLIIIGENVYSKLREDDILLLGGDADQRLELFLTTNFTIYYNQEVKQFLTGYTDYKSFVYKGKKFIESDYKDAWRASDLYWKLFYQTKKTGNPFLIEPNTPGDKWSNRLIKTLIENGKDEDGKEDVILVDDKILGRRFLVYNKPDILIKGGASTEDTYTNFCMLNFLLQNQLHREFNVHCSTYYDGITDSAYTGKMLDLILKYQDPVVFVSTESRRLELRSKFGDDMKIYSQKDFGKLNSNLRVYPHVIIDQAHLFGLKAMTILLGLLTKTTNEKCTLHLFGTRYGNSIDFGNPFNDIIQLIQNTKAYQVIPEENKKAIYSYKFEGNIDNIIYDSASLTNCLSVYSFYNENTIIYQITERDPKYSMVLACCEDRIPYWKNVLRCDNNSIKSDKEKTIIEVRSFWAMRMETRVYDKIIFECKQATLQDFMGVSKLVQQTRDKKENLIKKISIIGEKLEFANILKNKVTPPTPILEFYNRACKTGHILIAEGNKTGGRNALQASR